MRLCFATNNHHKIEEVMDVLGGEVQVLTLKVIGCEEELEETQKTIEGNASQKAKYIWEKYKVPCFADDTGLEVEGLGGAPGVYSARYAGPQRNADDNIALLLNRLSGQQNRSARFRTVISLVWSGGERLFEGIVEGVILPARRGRDGFGYDPVFLPGGSGKTLAEMSMQEKNLISHRARAMHKLISFLKSNKELA